MPRIDVNRSGENGSFVQVVDKGGFSAAARQLCMTPSAVSKLVTRLEARLGTRLVNRSTRKLQLTPEGTTFYEQSTRVLADMDEAERGAAAGADAARARQHQRQHADRAPPAAAAGAGLSRALSRHLRWTSP